ncbi:hypothetical protein ACO0LL_29160 [Undibacterium sp. TC4M20W]|uniref:hypothetical protein n=1 Tax=Undibacterium sp. TC4M20W TaxID=3413052 RepID=UPI003BF146FB
MRTLLSVQRLLLRLAASLATILGLGLAGTAAASAANVPTSACSNPAMREFDFWLGEWQVHTPDGKLAGTNSIQREYDGCVIHERYTTGRGYSGESLNIYDAPRKVWHQSWVDNSGTLLLLEGCWQGGKMVLEGQNLAPEGHKILHRITWTPNANGSARQLWESTDVKGIWAVAFDGLYTRK